MKFVLMNIFKTIKTINVNVQMVTMCLEFVLVVMNIVRHVMVQAHLHASHAIRDIIFLLPKVIHVQLFVQLDNIIDQVLA